MEFLFRCLTEYLTSERGKQVRYQVEREKRNSVSPSNHVLFCFLYKHLANKKLKPFTFQEENVLPFVRGAK